MPDHLQKIKTLQKEQNMKHMLLKSWLNLFLWYLPCELYIVNLYDAWDMGHNFTLKEWMNEQINKPAKFLFVNQWKIISRML